MISIVIPTLDPGPGFPEILAAVRGQEGDEPVDVLVIDSGSTDGTVDYLRSQPVRLLEIPNSCFNHGLTRARGVREARGRLVAFLTQDAKPADRRWLGSMADCFEDPSVAGAYSRQIPRPDAPPFIRYRLARYLAAEPERRVQSLATGVEMESMDPRERLRCIAFDDVSSIVRREVALEIPFGRVDHGEDLDWGSRVVAAGWKIIYEPRSVVIHSHDRPLLEDFKRVYRDQQSVTDHAGLEVTPSLGAMLIGTVSLAKELIRTVRGDSALSGRERAAWCAKALPFSLSQNLAQYLGARSRRRPEDPFVTRLVERIVRGAA